MGNNPSSKTSPLMAKPAQSQVGLGKAQNLTATPKDRVNRNFTEQRVPPRPRKPEGRTSAPESKSLPPRPLGPQVEGSAPAFRQQLPLVGESPGPPPPRARAPRPPRPEPGALQERLGAGTAPLSPALPSAAPGAHPPAGPARRITPLGPTALTREQRCRAGTRWDGAGAVGAVRGSLRQRRGARSAVCVAGPCGGWPCARRECERAQETSGRAGSGTRAAPAGERGRRQGPKVASSGARVPSGVGAAAREAAAADPGSGCTWAADPHEQQQRGRRWRRRRAGSEPKLRRGSASAGELRSADPWAPGLARRPGPQHQVGFPVPESWSDSPAHRTAAPPSGRRRPPQTHDF
ncbi:uncharacterized protein V5649_013851 [Rhynchonycteris naso]